MFIVSMLFEKLWIDIMGALTPAPSCHCYNLILIDYGIQYPEAVLF